MANTVARIYVYYPYYLVVVRCFLLIETAQAAGVIVKTDDDENDPARVSDLNFSHGWPIDNIVYLIISSTTNQPHKLQNICKSDYL